MIDILFAQYCFIHWKPPINAQAIIHNIDTSISFWVIKFITFILEHSRFTQHSKAVSKALRDKEQAMVILSQFHCNMLPISWATLADINSHIQYSSLYTANKLALSIWRALEMKTSHNSI